mgnify:CR=1 FL=1
MLNLKDFLDLNLYHISTVSKKDSQFTFKSCNESTFINTTYDSGNFDEYSYCPFVDEKEDLFLNFNEKAKEFLHLEIYNDKNIKKNQSITESLENEDILFLSIKYNLNLFDPENYTQPIRKNLYSQHTVLSQNKENWLSFKWNLLT